MATATEGSGRTRTRTAIVLAAMSGTAFFLAVGATQLVAAAIFDRPFDGGDERGPALEVTAADTRRSRTDEGTGLLARNIFDSRMGPLTWDVPLPPAPEPGDDEVEAPVDTTDPRDVHPACEGAVRLVGSWVRRDRPEQSFASITNAAGTPLLYREGMNVDDRAIVLIEAHRVVLRPTAGTLCDITMFRGAGGAAVATARTAPGPVVATAEVPAVPGGVDTGIPGLDAAELDANITSNGDSSWTINRALVDRLLANQAALMSAARVIPHEVDGRVVGVKIYGIRRSSLLGRLGVQNGDMLRTINGFDLTEPDSVLQAYTNLRSADHLSLSIERRGSPVTLDYTIH